MGYKLIHQLNFSIHWKIDSDCKMSASSLKRCSFVVTRDTDDYFTVLSHQYKDIQFCVLM